MRLLLQPEHAAQAERHFDATRTTLKYYGEWFGAVSLRPHHDRRSRLPERRRTGWSTRRSSPPAHGGWSRRRSLTRRKSVTIHEAGHQFWYGMVANNEFEDAWMDEGLNTFSTARVDAAGLRSDTTSRCGTSAASCPGCSTTSRSAARPTATGWPATGATPKSDVPSTPSFRVLPSRTGAQRHHLQQDGAVAEHAGAPARVADAAAHHGDVLRAMEVQASEAGRLLRRRRTR